MASAGTVDKGFFSAFEQHQRVFAARKKQGRALESCGDFTQYEDRFFFQSV
jgi:hypothetical protein